jgi:hypothetical protein
MCVWAGPGNYSMNKQTVLGHMTQMQKRITEYAQEHQEIYDLSHHNYN